MLTYLFLFIVVTTIELIYMFCVFDIFYRAGIQVEENIFPGNVWLITVCVYFDTKCNANLDWMQVPGGIHFPELEFQLRSHIILRSRHFDLSLLESVARAKKIMDASKEKVQLRNIFTNKEKVHV